MPLASLSHNASMRILSVIALLLVSLVAVADSNECVPKQSPPPAETFEFSGTVHAGQSFHCDLTSGISFHLDPDKGGWNIAVRFKDHPQNFAHDDPNSDEDALAIPGTQPPSVNAPALERRFSVLLGGPAAKFSEHPPISTFKSTTIKLGEPSSDKPFAPIEELSFDVELKLPSAAGIVVFQIAGTAGVTPPKTISAPDPEYSEQARQKRYEGTVRLWCIVDVDGLLKDIRVQRSLGEGLDQKAIEAVKKWKFRPATFEGDPVPVKINIDVNFRLRR
jgi:TonB family protein